VQSKTINRINDDILVILIDSNSGPNCA